MKPIRNMTEAEKQRFAYNPDAKPTGDEIDNFPEIRADQPVENKNRLPINISAKAMRTTYKRSKG